MLYYLFLNFHARHPAKFSLTLCLMPSNNDGSKRLLLRSTVSTPAVAERNDEKNKNKTKEKDGSNLLQDLCKINNHQHHSRELRIHQH